MKAKTELNYTALLEESCAESIDIAAGRRKPARVTVVQPLALEVRQKLRVSRPKFAALIGVSERTVENWEQGRNKPTGAARALLKVAAHSPGVVLEALKSVNP